MAEQNHTEEIDLGYLLNKVNRFFKRMVRGLFLAISFFLKYWIIVLVLLIVGIGYGYYLDSQKKITYINEGIVIPNFESVDYLYKNIEYLNEKINERDTIFLKTMSPSAYNNLRNIEIEPISDIYNMMTKSREQIDVFRILFQNQDIENFVTDLTTSKYFKYHKISFTTIGEKHHSKEIIDAIFNYWDTNEHFVAYKEVYKQNIDFQVKEHKKMIAQIDSIINAVTTNSSVPNSGVVISENSNFHFLLERKKALLDELLEVELKQEDYDTVVRLVNMDYNIVENPILSNKVKYPLIFIFIFSFFFFMLFLFKRMKRYAGVESL